MASSAIARRVRISDSAKTPEILELLTSMSSSLTNFVLAGRAVKVETGLFKPFSTPGHQILESEHAHPFFRSLTHSSFHTGTLKDKR